MKLLENAKVLVTGGAGFIGHHLVSELLKYKIKKIYVADDLSTGLKSNLTPFSKDSRLELIEIDISDFNKVENLPAVDYIFNLAALVSVPLSFSESAKNNNINIVGFQNILEYAKRHQAKKIIYASSSAVYGNPTKTPISEDAIIKPTSPYGFSKSINEIYAKTYKEFFDIDSNGFRFFNVYGKGQKSDSPYSGVISIFREKMIQNGEISIFGDGEQTRDFVFIEDLVKILISSIELKNTSEIFNLGTGKSTSINELFNTMASLFNYNKSPSYKEVRSGDIVESVADIQKLKNSFDIKATTNLHEGLKFLKDNLQIT
ncbi:UDP-glucose 4-epimerase [Marivirga sericea]|uniref:UDP-glucose 4-epimerase n=1 Tax=Marivirga sericea TaxID=1028 RepID=A0A1X7J7F9_9BACT|nr:NAD-dependent epimerase/dehydratase family protein [Marivirga sericea]SMG23567.1 UDP-glucose 4-epimerase [Marivirga sericea]